MKVGAWAVLAACLLQLAAGSGNIYQFTPIDIDENPYPLKQLEGRVLLVVNVATYWGETKTDYTQLTALQKKYNNTGHGLTVLGFPCNQFANQEPGSDPTIKKFAESYGILKAGGVWFHKIKVNFSPIPLYHWLKKENHHQLLIKWNFEKYLIDHKGNFLSHYGTTTDPYTFEDKIKAALNA